MAAENAVQEEQEQFAKAFAGDEEKPEEEEEEEQPEPEPEPEPEEAKPVDAEEEQRQATEANRSTLLGKIRSARKGLPKMEATYRETYGHIPGDLTEEDLEERRRREESLAQVQEDLPEVMDSIRHHVDAARGEIRDDVERDLTEQRMVAHFGAIRTAHPDIEAFQTEGSPERELLNEWIDSHSYQGGAILADILANGEAAEVIDMLDLFKEEVEAILTEQPEGEGEGEGEPEVDPVVRRVVDDAAAAEAVRAGQERTPISAPVADENDFSGAFKQAVADDT